MPIHDSELPRVGPRDTTAEKRTPIWLLLGAVIVAGIFFFYSIGAFAEDAAPVEPAGHGLVFDGHDEIVEPAPVPAEDVPAPEEADAKTLKASFFDRASKAWDYAVDGSDEQLAAIAKQEAELADKEHELSVREEALAADIQMQEEQLTEAMTNAEITFKKLQDAVGALSSCVLSANQDLTEPLAE